MAEIDSRVQLSTERPAGQAPEVYQTKQPRTEIAANPRSFGAAAAKGTEELGQGGQRLGDRFGQIAADEVANAFQDEANKILHGDPDKSVQGPDGATIQDQGYLGLKGRAALDQRQAYTKRLDDLERKARGVLYSPDQMYHFDQMTRRYRAIINDKVGAHYDREQNVWATNTHRAEIKTQVGLIASNPNDPEMVLHASSDLVGAYVKLAELQGAKPGDSLWTQAVREGKATAAKAQILAIEPTDPRKAQRMVENYREILGAEYQPLADKVRARAGQQEGREIADWMMTGAPPPEGSDAAKVVRHFEGFISEPKRDTDGKLRVGYGSDTVTHADGTYSPVTAETRVTREDAERDLARRLPQFQADVRKHIGNEAWVALSPEAKASLSSIAYNYGTMGKPELAPVVAAARSGDAAQLANSIRALGTHNGGINARRRASEAQNIAPGDKATPSTQSDLINEVLAKNLSPEAETAAIGRINRAYALQKSAQVRSRTTFETSVKDNEAEALNTGNVTNPIGESEFIGQYGEAGPVKFQEYNAKVQYGVDRQSFSTMPNHEIRTTIEAREKGAQPGSPGYAARMDRVKQMRKAADDIEKTRREDPASAADQMPAVKDALQTYDPKKPETFGLVATARMAAQEELGIDADYRSPITKSEALQMMKPVQQALPGLRAQALEETGAKFRNMFGDDAPRAFVYALRAMHLSGEVDIQAASGVIESLMKGRPITQQEQRDFRDAQQGAQIEQALRAQPQPIPTEDWMLRVTGVDQSTPAPDPGKRPIPNAKDIKNLRDNPQLAGQFDKDFGPGTAKKLMETYPLYFQKRPR